MIKEDCIFCKIANGKIPCKFVYETDDVVAFDGKKYYFTSAGYMATGVQTIEGKKYFFDEKGSLKTGWCEVFSKKYYAEQTGELENLAKANNDNSKNNILLPNGDSIEKRKYNTKHFSQHGISSL